MSWVVVGVTGATAALGAIQGNQQRKDQQRANQQQANITAAQQESSPWTGIKPQAFSPSAVTASGLEGGVKGGMSGAMTGMSMKKGFDESDAAKKLADEEERKRQMGMLNSGQALS